jgi:hypothetical protein
VHRPPLAGFVFLVVCRQLAFAHQRGNHRSLHTRAPPLPSPSFACLYLPACVPFAFRLAHLRLLERSPDLASAYVKSPRWVFAFLVYVFGQLLNFLSLSFASQSLLATLGTFSLVTNIVYAGYVVPRVVVVPAARQRGGWEGDEGALMLPLLGHKK